MKMLKPFMVIAGAILLLVGCNPGQIGYSGGLILEVTRDIMVDVYDEDEGYLPIRSLGESDQEPVLEEITEVWDVLNHVEWKEGQVIMGRPADFRFETYDNRKDKKVYVHYEFWITPDGKRIVLANKDKSLHAELDEATSEKLYTPLIGNSITEPVFPEGS